MSPPGDSWQITDRILTQPSDRVRARIDLDSPAAGVEIAVAGGPVDHLLGVDLAAPHSGGSGASPLVDHWLRGADVTAVYEPADPRRLRASVMWRARETGGPISAWEAVVSAQTSLLETDGSVAVVTDVAAADLFWAAFAPDRLLWKPCAAGARLPGEATCILARRHGPGATSVLVAVHPGDARRFTTLECTGRTRIDSRLFPTALEKGVLLRGRVLAAIGPAVGDTEWAGPIVAAFAASPPPLTT